MPNPNDVLANSITGAQRLINRYCDDLAPAEYLRRPCDGGNTTAWIVGHLVLSDRSALGRLGVAPADLPALPEGFEKRFSREPEAPKASDFGDVSVLLPLFNRHRELFAQTVRAAS